MKLSEAIRVGAKIRPQGFGGLYETRETTERVGWFRKRVKREKRSCVLGAALEAADCKPHDLQSGESRGSVGSGTFWILLLVLCAFALSCFFAYREICNFSAVRIEQGDKIVKEWLSSHVVIVNSAINEDLKLFAVNTFKDLFRNSEFGSPENKFFLRTGRKEGISDMVARREKVPAISRFRGVPDSDPRHYMNVPSWGFAAICDNYFQSEVRRVLIEPCQQHPFNSEIRSFSYVQRILGDFSTILSSLNGSLVLLDQFPVVFNRRNHEIGVLNQGLRLKLHETYLELHKFSLPLYGLQLASHRFDDLVGLFQTALHHSPLSPIDNGLDRNNYNDKQTQRVDRYKPNPFRMLVDESPINQRQNDPKNRRSDDDVRDRRGFLALIGWFILVFVYAWFVAHRLDLHWNKTNCNTKTLDKQDKV